MTGLEVPTTWKRVAQLLGVSRAQVYRIKDLIGVEDDDRPEDAYPRMAKYREFTKNRVGGDRTYTASQFLRREINERR
jgi:hypothetical protein